MKIFKKQRLWLYIVFSVAAVIIIVFKCVERFNSNILIGEWITDDGVRIYSFDEHTVSISSTENDYNELYGYYLKSKTEFILQSGDNAVPYEFYIQDDKLYINRKDNNADSAAEVMSRYLSDK